MPTRIYGDNTLGSGQRVELHPATDLWMRGRRYGEIIGVRAQSKKQQAAGATVTYLVIVDGENRPRRVTADNLSAI